MSTLKLTAASGGGTVALKGPATTSGNAALELTVPGAESGELVTKDSDDSLVNVQGINGGQISHRNLFQNGDMSCWQRGTSGTTSGTYVADRWWFANATSSARDTSAPDGFVYSNKLTYNSSDMSIGQPIELPATGKSGRMISGEKLTISFYAKVSATTEACSCQVKFRDSKFSSSNEVSFTISDANLTLTTSWQRFTKTFTIPTVAGTNTIAAFEVSGISKDAFFTGFQAEIGDYATSYEFKTYQQELAACMRYYETHNHLTTAKTTDGSVTSQWSTITSNDSNTLVVSTGIVYKVPKRAWPTITLYNPGDTSTAARVNAQGTERTVTASYGGANALTRIYVSGASSGNYVTYNWEADAEL